jgi:UDP-glucuronate 4-epimerase
VKGSRVVVTGATGQVAMPVALALAAENEVWAAARFTDTKARARLEEAGVRCAVVDLSTGDLSALPDDPDYVLHFAVTRSDSFDDDLRDNAEATGLLMERSRSARGFLLCSSTGVYEPSPEPVRETDPLADNHRVMFTTYSIVKIATEAVARTCARLFDLPTVIARLNVPYGDNGGWPFWHLVMMEGGMEIPVQPGGSTRYNPVHEDDFVRLFPALLDHASVPATIVNLAGDVEVSIEEWCAELASLTGIELKLAATTDTLPSVTTDNSKMRSLVGGTTVDWRDGLRRMVEARRPELLRG